MSCYTASIVQPWKKKESFKLDNFAPGLIYKPAIRLAIINKSGTQSIEEW
jgi:hypothetical protein